LTSRTFGETVLGRIASEFSRAYPRISVHITLADRETATPGMDLISGGFDIAIRTLPVREKSLVARAITGLPRILVATPGYVERRGLPRTPSELTRHNCLDPSGATHYNWNFRGPAGETSVRVSGSPCANSSLVIRNAALEGLGIAIMREYLVIDDIAAGALVRILPNYRIDERTLYVVYHRDRRQPMRIKMFIDYLSKRVEECLKDATAVGFRER
jgi:DNA-binding transcriptional LysR family regulator